VVSAESTKQPPTFTRPVRITEHVWPEGTVPVVTIPCITYNHEPFIRDAIEGFLLQETSFPVQILVHDDASTDGTAEIIKEYAAKHPQLFRIVLQTENQWSKGIRPSKYLQPMIRGQFVALCEGDDYWTDPLKLQKQVSLLELNPEASGSFHAASVISEVGEELEVRPAIPVPSRLTFNDVVVRNHLLTCSLVYRCSVASTSSPWSAGLRMADWPLQVNLARYGDLLGIDENMGCYRRHRGGVWTKMSQSDELKAIGEFYSAVSRAFTGSLPREFYRRHTDHYQDSAQASLHERKFLRGCREWISYLWNRWKYFFSSATPHA
jgi:glycosyltransferase involved in cell wall biosynthesis